MTVWASPKRRHPCGALDRATAAGFLCGRLGRFGIRAYASCGATRHSVPPTSSKAWSRASLTLCRGSSHLIRGWRAWWNSISIGGRAREGSSAVPGRRTGPCGSGTKRNSGPPEVGLAVLECPVRKLEHLRRNRPALLRAIAEARARYEELFADGGQASVKSSQR